MAECIERNPRVKPLALCLLNILNMVQKQPNVIVQKATEKVVDDKTEKIDKAKIEIEKCSKERQFENKLKCLDDTEKSLLRTNQDIKNVIEKEVESLRAEIIDAKEDAEFSIKQCEKIDTSFEDVTVCLNKIDPEAGDHLEAVRILLENAQKEITLFKQRMEVEFQKCENSVSTVGQKKCYEDILTTHANSRFISL